MFHLSRLRCVCKSWHRLFTGLFLLGCIFISTSILNHTIHINDDTIVLWNPSIREYKILPTSCNFRKTREVLGIDFVSSLNDYKIIEAPSTNCSFIECQGSCIISFGWSCRLCSRCFRFS